LVQVAKSVGHNSIAITDHGTLAGHRALQRAAKAEGIKPILGVEAYISATDRFDRRAKAKREEGDQVYNHLILLAKNQNGMRNIQKLSQVAWNEGYYHKPRIDFEILDEFGDDLIVLSGCLNGLIAKAIERGDDASANMWTKAFVDRFGKDFYMEVQTHNPLNINNGLLDMADLYGVKPVVTADCHYASAEQRAIEEAFLILSTNPARAADATFAGMREKKDMLEKFNYLYPERKMSFQEWDLFITERESMHEQMVAQEINRTDIYDNTLEVAEKIGDYEYYADLDLLPRPVGDANVELTTACNLAMNRLGLNNKQEYKDRLAEELGVIKSKDFASYFIVVAEAIEWARSKNIMVGPGRGSAAGSLVCYLLGITQVDPIPYDLLFSRFIDEERNDWPDIDIDFEDGRRGEVKQHMVEKYPSVGNIVTFNYFRDKGVIKDAARVFSVPVGETEAVLKKVEDFEGFEDSNDTLDYRNKYPEVLDMARTLRGKIRGTGLHAAGLIVSRLPLEDYAPIESRTDTDSKDKSRLPAIALDMNEAADLGLIKIDFLGLKTLTVIHETLDMVNKHRDENTPEVSLPWNFDDPRVFRGLSTGQTVGVFQAEQSAYTKLLKEMGVSTFEHLAASTALVRPGAYNTVGVEYIARKNGRAQDTQVHPIYDEITAETHGLIIYQEQVMRACTDLAGMTKGDANKIRRIIGKKKDSTEFDAYRQKFLSGCEGKITTEQAEGLWHDFEAHAGYSFNKSHAVAYSIITYWTAWLKYYYPTEFLCSILRSQEKPDELTPYLIECKRLGVKIGLPNINVSPSDFEVVDGKILYGLQKVKYLSDVTASIIIRHRPYQSQKDFDDLVYAKGSGINTRIASTLRAVGATLEPKTGEEGNNYYEYLGIPKFDLEAIPATLRESVMRSDEIDEAGISILLGLAKDIVRKNGWCRVEFVDEGGGFSGFTSPSTQIEKGQMYLVMKAGSSISRYIAATELKDMKGDALVKYLKGKVTLAHKEYYVISANYRRSKAGKDYAELVLANSKGELRKVMAFSKQFVHALAHGKPGNKVSLSVGTMDDGTLVLRSIKQIEDD